MEKIDAFIPASPKDQLKLGYAIKALAKHFKQLGDVHVSVPDKTKFKDYEEDGHKVVVHEDFDLLPVQALVASLRFRPNWIFQQWLKLFQQATSDIYLVWDADCILTRDFDAYEDGKLKLLAQPNDADEAAFSRFSAKATGGVLGQWTDCVKWPTTYIADFALFNRKWIEEMVMKFFPSANEFLRFSTLNTYWKKNDTHHAIFLSEYQLMGEFTAKYHLKDVAVTKLKKKQIDKFQMS